MLKMMNAGRVIMFFSLVIVVSAFAQTPKTASSNASAQVWEIPFASTDNTISLSIQNSSNIEAKSVSVTFDNVPIWLNFKSNTVFLKNIAANGSGDAEFTFSVDKKAPVGQEARLTAEISISDGQRWTKYITIQVEAPKDYKLYDNFPNPFNPSTKIAFELPKGSHVRLIIYDVVGREVAQVADGDYPAGYNEVVWNGMNRNGEQVSSGVYFCRISTDNWSAIKKMLMLR